MKKLLYLVSLAIILLTITGCSSKTINTDSLIFEQQGINYSLSPQEQGDSYNQLIDDLNDLDVQLDQNTEVAVVATSTANILDSLGMNIVGVTNSKSLDENLQEKLKNQEITDLGSPLDPNLEELVKLNPDIVFVGSNMPHQDKYSKINNLIVLPQEYYYDVFYTIDALIKEFSLDQEAQNIFNQMVIDDQHAKELASGKEVQGTTVALKYAYGNFTIATNNTYVGTLLKELHIDNMYGELKDVNLAISLEKLLVDNPDNIVLYGKGEDMIENLNEIKQNPKLKNLSAYQNNKIYVLQSESLNADIDSAKTLLTLSEDIYGKEN